MNHNVISSIAISSGRRALRLVPALSLAILFALPQDVYAGRAEGIMAEFRKVEEAIRSRQKTPEARKRTLEENLQRALTLAISRRFHRKKTQILENLSPETFQYENPTSELVYYVKYDNYIVRFDFIRDPEIYIQAPAYEKFLIISEGQPEHESEEEQPTP